MSVAEFTFTQRARPVVQIGLGDTRIDTGAAQWDVSRWSDFNHFEGDEWAGTQPYWLDITCWVHETQFAYGRRRATDRFEPGWCHMLIDNSTGFADINPPDDDVALLELRPGRSVRVGVVHTDFGLVWLWRGYIDECKPLYSPTLNDMVDVVANCALGEVGRVELPALSAPIGANELAGTRVRRFLNDADWPADMRDVDDTGVHLIADGTGGQVADLLGIVADSAGGAVFGDTAGRLAFRGKDWQVFEATRQPDGYIGNVDTGGLATPAYLDPQIGYAGTPDPGVVPTQFTLVARVHGPIGPGEHTIASQWDAEAAWVWQYKLPGQRMRLIINRDGVANILDVTLEPPFAPNPEPHGIALTVNNSGATTVTTVWTQDAAGVWHSNPTQSWTKAVPFNAASAVNVGAIGLMGAGVSRWRGFIESVEMRSGLIPTGGTIEWRFDAENAELGKATWIDPRGDVWLIGSPDAITAGQEASDGDVCPTGMDFSSKRSDIVTKVVLGRINDTQHTWNDARGQALFGVETYRAVDLVTRDDNQLETIAERLFRTRGYNATPRLEHGTFDAATSDAALDLITACDVFGPSLYRVRFQRPDRGIIFNRLMFAAGIEHRMDRNRWSADISFDWATGWQIEGARWDADLWDLSTWVA